MGVTPRDEMWMRRALALANEAMRHREVPVGALMVKRGEIIAEGFNRPIASHDPTAHAEIEVLRQAAYHLKNYRLPGTTLYVTLEPCPMCLGAMIHARIGKLVYGAADPRQGAAGTVFSIHNSENLNHRIPVVGGVLAQECGQLLKDFFSVRRTEIAELGTR